MSNPDTYAYEKDLELALEEIAKLRHELHYTDKVNLLLNAWLQQEMDLVELQGAFLDEVVQ